MNDKLLCAMLFGFLRTTESVHCKEKRSSVMDSTTFLFLSLLKVTMKVTERENKSAEAVLALIHAVHGFQRGWMDNRVFVSVRVYFKECLYLKGGSELGGG